MIDKKYNKVLTVILVIVGVLIVGALGFWGYEIYTQYYTKKSTKEAVQDFDNIIASFNNNQTNSYQNVSLANETSNVTLENTTESLNTTETNTNTNKNTSSSSSKVSTQTYKGFTVVGKIEIPKTNVSLPVLNVATKKSMEASVGVVFGPGLNKVGNTVILGHNYRNGTFFSNNKNLVSGDLIYITDTTGARIKYTIYNTYTTGSDDFDYATRDTAGKREISLSTCTDDVKSRLVIWAKED